ncbi:carbon-nitrogen hydrolase family protein [Crenobacter cavernae]|uniref:Carbon-nitrogen hydrolase family protein n=1 Tax=Crenobacter cavernae TaxID=2290923 RepID=A0ABY0FGL7_9NEIS|nr:carbon-nitrogen hydrolase family protein [Crenobacter cavernae]RXZ45460.1 carbon-nitrogen hydrolase family protein [Crenobacter cavernae]
MTTTLTAAAIQMVSGDDCSANLEAAARLVAEAAARGAGFAALPEYFYLMPEDETARLSLAERFGGGPIQTSLAGLAREHGIWLLAGSVPLASPEVGKFYNSSLLFDPQGHCKARYDKIHLFGFDNGEERYLEADTMSAGDTVASVDTPWGVTRLSICYDLRFPELYRQDPAPTLITAPAAFTYTTGKAHWELLLRARAVENLAFVVAPGQGGVHPGGKRTFGHSLIVDPWGEVLASCEDGEGIALATLDFSRQAEWRTRLPALDHRRLGPA